MNLPNHNSSQYDNPYKHGTQNAVDWESKRQTAMAQERLYKQ